MCMHLQFSRLQLNLYVDLVEQAVRSLGLAKFQHLFPYIWEVFFHPLLRLCLLRV